jgi:hypothetical protein
MAGASCRSGRKCLEMTTLILGVNMSTDIMSAVCSTAARLSSRAASRACTEPLGNMLSWLIITEAPAWTHTTGKSQNYSKSLGAQNTPINRKAWVAPQGCGRKCPTDWPPILSRLPELQCSSEARRPIWLARLMTIRRRRICYTTHDSDKKRSGCEAVNALMQLWQPWLP